MCVVYVDMFSYVSTHSLSHNPPIILIVIAIVIFQELSLKSYIYIKLRNTEVANRLASQLAKFYYYMYSKSHSQLHAHNIIASYTCNYQFLHTSSYKQPHLLVTSYSYTCSPMHTRTIASLVKLSIAILLQLASQVETLCGSQFTLTSQLATFFQYPLTCTHTAN